MPDNKPNHIAPSLAEALQADKSFVHFDARLQAEEAQTFAALNINAGATYDNFGATGLIKAEAERFFISLGNGKEEAARCAATVERLAKEALEAFGAEAGWLTIRATLPTTAFDTPRWHQDGTFFETPNGEQKKVAIALKGAATLFNDLPNSLSGKFRDALRSAPDSKEQRLKLMEIVQASDTVTGEAGQGAIFVSGSTRAAVHSEPPMHTPRIFVSIVPGTTQQIEELRQRWQRPVTTYAAPPAEKAPAPQ